MLTQVDSDGMSTTLMEAIVDHRRDEETALQHHDKYVQTKSRRCHLRKTTKGCELLIKWKDKSESWIKLADMKESHPVEVSEYARARGIDKGPAFEWWVPHTLKKRQVILAALKKRTRKTTHKYGIEIPIVEFWGLPPLIPLLQCVNRLGFEICSVDSCQTEQGSLVTLI